MKEVPIFIINGLLDSGKTTFTQTIIMSDGFYKEGNTLLLLLETGEVEYDDLTLYDRYNTTVLSLDSPSDLSKDKISQIVDMHDIDRIIIENNAMLDGEFDFPDNCKIAQIVTIIDASNFEIYFANMRVKMADMIRPASVIIFNRIDNKIEKLLSYKRSVMLLNNEAEFIFQDSKGQLIEKLEDELPYNLNDKIISIKDDDYGIFYIDSYDSKDRYIGKTVNFNALVYIDKDVILGRLTMTCCENDITLLGFISNIKDKLENNTWINVTAKISYKVITDKEEPVLEVINYKKIEKIQKPIVNL